MIAAVEIFLVPHTHWDREWYQTFQTFRARLVDVVDRVLELLDADPGYVFLLDGQSIILEDYLEIRPDRRQDLERAVRQGRIEIGPWYVQPDTLLPSGEAHIRNLLEGRRVAEQIGPPSTVAYTPDSFGHPAQLPQILKGFGLSSFVYWRGNGDEIDRLPAEYLWEAPEGSSVVACHLAHGYGNAAALERDPSEAVKRLRPIVEALAARSKSGRILLMNGSDHLPPDPHTEDVTEALADATGSKVNRSLLQDFVSGIDRDLPSFSGELLGARVANLLPGVWSSRMPLKLRNRRCELLLEGWAEPWAAIGRMLGTADEQPSLKLAWRSLLQNQAHDSICGCSQDAVHEQMQFRYDVAEELATHTTRRILERIAGLGRERRLPPKGSVGIAVFNPSPHSRTDLVRLPLDAYPIFGTGEEHSSQKGFAVGGRPARLVEVEAGRRLRLLPSQRDWDIEFVAEDVPPFGWRRLTLEAAQTALEEIDEGTDIVAGDISVAVEENGTLTVGFDDARFRGLCALEDVGDRGDTYDFDPVGEDWSTEKVEVERRRHSSGIQSVEVRRMLRTPAGLSEDRVRRSDETASIQVVTEALVAPEVGRVDLKVRVENSAQDHRLRMLFPTGAPIEKFHAASTFAAALRSTALRSSKGWRHPAPTTFPHQGWISANGLTVISPGLPEAEVTSAGTIAVTLLRAVGWLSRPDLSSRPGGAGPSLPTPAAQCLQTIIARFALMHELDIQAARDAELGLVGVFAGDQSLAPPDVPLLSLEPQELLVSAMKPAENGGGIILRVLNPVDRGIEATVIVGFLLADAAAVRLDESPTGEPVTLDGHTIRFNVPARSLRSVLLS
jgi:mannosylglycerate hydrolase